jgi:hypothetical protein
MSLADDLARRQLAAAKTAANVWADGVLGEAQRLAPIEEGTLRASGDRETTDRAGGFEIVISFSTVYAARQHEELDWTHPKGGQAKYLEEPFKRRLPRLEPTIAAAAAAAMR